MTQVTITHSDGSTESIPETLGWERRREIGKMRRVKITVSRGDAQSVSLNPKQDKLSLGDIDTVRLVDVESGGATWTLRGYSFEWDANRVEPTGGGDLREGTDQDLVSGLVGEVGSWSAGTIEQHTNGIVSFILNHSHRHEALRRIERNVPGELRFRDEGTVDYVAALGSDKTDSITLSPSNRNIEKSIKITKRGRELDGTHFRVLGAHEGEAQIHANLVPESDPASYENRVDYSTSRWSDGDPRDWDRWVNKDVSSQSTIMEEARALGDELGEGLVEVETTVSGLGLDVGDWVHVTKPDAGLDCDMRVHRVRTIQSGASRVQELLLSTRTTVRRDVNDQARDISRYNVAFEGSSVVLQGGGDRQPVTANHPAVIPFRYPDVSYEHRVELEVRGLPYRAFSQGAESSQTGEALNSSHQYITQGTIYDTTNNSDRLSYAVVPEAESGSFNGAFISYGYRNATGSSQDITMQIQNGAGSDGEVLDYIMRTAADGGGVNESYYAPASEVSPGDSIYHYVSEGDVGTESGKEFLGGMELYVTTVATHTHEPQPGIIDSFPDHSQADASGRLLPSGCDVIVNGSTVASDIGSGEFETVVDLTGELTQGSWNTIEVTSDSTGHVLATPYIEAYKQIGSN